MGVKQTKYSSIEHYLEQEEQTSIKHEFERGEILAMTDGSINHGILCGNAYTELRYAIKDNDQTCTALGSEIRIHIEAVDSIVYPDAMVICKEIETSKEDSEAVTNPSLIVEVLSKSTESYDRGDKFYKYRQLESFKEYVLINQDKTVVETFFRKEENVWEIARFVAIENKVLLKSLGVSFSIKDLYTNVSLKET